MIKEFLETIETEDYFDTGFLNFISAQFSGHGSNLKIVIRIQFAILSEPGIEMTQFWQIDCSQVQKYTISTDPSIYQNDQIKLLDEHCLLWDYSQPQKSLLIGTEKISPVIETLVGNLFLRHQALTNHWIPFKISHEALTKGNDLLARGPEEVINTYQQVLEEAGIQCSSYISDHPRWFKSGKGWIEEPQKFQVMIIGDSYIVASKINAKKLSECAPSFWL